jgi:murein DD-endopeptidase MepM/ murein hydrolase activator NlpD
MFCATGAAVATSPRAQKQLFSQSAAAMASPLAGTAAQHAHLLEVERAQAATAASALKEIDRATEVARGQERMELAAAADLARRTAFAHSWRLPITDPVTTSGFGYRWGVLHAGEDFAVSVGTPLASMSTGTVIYAGQESGFGNLVEIRYWDGTISYFGHMSIVSVMVGDAVKPAEIVGQSGNTGHSTGPHLHLEIHPNGGKAVDPLPWLAAHHIAV